MGADLVWPPVRQPVSGAFDGGFVLLNDTRGDAPAFADRNARLFRPGPDTAALPA
jgi:hypothetical protein